MSDNVEALLAELRREMQKLQEKLGPPPLILTMERAAREMSISPRTVSRMVRAGLLQVCKVNGKRMVPLSEVQRIAASKAAEGTPMARRPRRLYPVGTGAEKIRAALKRR